MLFQYCIGKMEHSRINQNQEQVLQIRFNQEIPNDFVSSPKTRRDYFRESLKITALMAWDLIHRLNKKSNEFEIVVGKTTGCKPGKTSILLDKMRLIEVIHIIQGSIGVR